MIKKTGIIQFFILSVFLFLVSFLHADDLVSSFDISPDSGRIMERVSPIEGKPTLICILDAHANPDAQHKIAKILDECFQDENINLIGVEGAAGIVVPDVFRTVPDSEYLEELLESYIKDGIITGVEYYAVRIHPDAILYGMEKGGLYRENLTAYRAVDAKSQEAMTFIKDLEERLEMLQETIFSPELAELNTLSSQYQEGTLPATDFIIRLSDFHKNAETDWSSFTQLDTFIKAIELEKEIDFDAVKDEIAQITSFLEKKLTKEDLQELLKITLKYRLGKVPEKIYHETVINFLKKAEKDPAEYKNFYLFTKYRRRMEILEYETLFTEIDQAIKIEIEALLETPDEWNLYMLQKIAELYKKALILELSRTDFIRYQDARRAFSAVNLLARTNDLLRNNGFEQLNPDNLRQKIEAFNNALEKVDSFYKLATKRDEAMLDNILREMYDRRQASVCVVVGGFHKDGIVALAKERGLGCIVITPTITDAGDVEVYHRAMTGVRLPLTEKIRKK